MTLAKLLSLFKSIFNPITQGNNRLLIYATALSYLGKDASPNDVAPDEYGCAETVYDILQDALGRNVGISFTVSTNALYNELRTSKAYVQTDQPLEGDIWISPTGLGNGNLPNGHVAIVGQVDNTTLGNTLLMSNNSATGNFLQNYTIQTWEDRYVTLGGYPCFIFRKI